MRIKIILCAMLCLPVTLTSLSAAQGDDATNGIAVTGVAHARALLEDLELFYGSMSCAGDVLAAVAISDKDVASEKVRRAQRKKTLTLFHQRNAVLMQSLHAGARTGKSTVLSAACTAVNKRLREENPAALLEPFDVSALPVLEQLLLADTYALHGNIDSALPVYDSVGKGNEGIHKAYASEGMGDIYYQHHQLKRSLAWFDLAVHVLSYMDRYKEKTFVHRAYMQTVKRKRKHVVDMLLLMEHGIGFVLYKRGNEQLQRKRYGQARASFEALLSQADANRGNDFQALVAAFSENAAGSEQALSQLPVRPVYEQAALLLRNQALIGLGESETAYKNLKRFIASDTYGIYRGDAYRLLAEIHVQVERNPKKAVKQYTQAIKWVARVRSQSARLAAYAVPEASLDITAAPESWKKKDAWGNIVWEHASGQSLVNRLTAPWYLDALLVECYMQRSLCFFVLGKRKQALADIEKMYALDVEDQRLTRSSGYSNYNRLKDGYRTGRLYATQAELSLFPMKTKLPLMNAELYFETEQWKKAITAYSQLIEEFGGTLKKGPMAYLYYAKASAYLYQGKTKLGSLIIRSKFVGTSAPYRDTMTWPRAMFAMANIDQRKDPWKWLWIGYKGTNSREYKTEFLMKISQYHYGKNTNDHDVQAVPVLNRILKEAPKNDYRRRASQQFLEGIRRRSPEALGELKK